MNVDELEAKYDLICQRLSNPLNAAIYNDWNTTENSIPAAYETRIQLQKVREELMLLKEQKPEISQQGTFLTRVQGCNRMLDEVSHLLDENGFI